MNVVDIVDYLYRLERLRYTGQVTLNFHKGSVSKKIEEKPMNIFLKDIKKSINEDVKYLNEDYPKDMKKLYKFVL